MSTVSQYSFILLDMFTTVNRVFYHSLRYMSLAYSYGLAFKFDLAKNSKLLSGIWTTAVTINNTLWYNFYL